MQIQQQQQHTYTKIKNIYYYTTVKKNSSSKLNILQNFLRRVVGDKYSEEERERKYSAKN